MAYVKITQEMVEQALRETDWAKLDAQTDEEIIANIASDPDAPPLMSAADMAYGAVRVIKRKLGITEEQFSDRFKIPMDTLQDWEQNRIQPDQTAMAYIRVISHNPEMVAKVFELPQPQPASLTPA